MCEYAKSAFPLESRHINKQAYAHNDSADCPGEKKTPQSLWVIALIAIVADIIIELLP